MLELNKILVATDFSEDSDTALSQTFDLAKKYNAKVYVLHVVADLNKNLQDYGLPPLEAMKKMETDTLNSARAKTQEQIDKFPLAKELNVESDVVLGNPSELITKEAAAKKVDLIVIGALGRTKIAKIIIGSVARNVMKSSKCPVLLAK